MKKLYIVFTVLLLASILVMPGCGGATPTTSVSSTPTATTTPPTSSSAPTTTPGIPNTLPPTSASPTSTSTQQIQKGGTLIFITTAQVRNLGDTAKTQTPADGNFDRCCLETLMGTDSAGNYVPRLAKSWDIAADGKSIVFHLQEGVLFHDNTPFNADAVKFNLDHARKGERGANLSAIDSIDVIDTNTVKINLKSFNWLIMSVLTTGVLGQIISPTALQTLSQDELYVHPVGTGPFQFDSYEKDVSLKFKRWDHYWQKDAEGNPYPYMDGVEFKLMADPTTALMSFEAGEGQWLDGVQPHDASGLIDAGYNIVKVAGGVWFLAPDSVNTDSPFHDVRVRQAVAYAINRQEMADAIGYGYYNPDDQIFGSWSWLYSKNVKGYPYDVAKAKELLKAAGYANGFTITINVQTGGSMDPIVALQAMLADVNITLGVNMVSAAEFAQLGKDGWHGLHNLNTMHTIGIDPGQSLGASFMSGGQQCVSTYVDPALTDLFKKANTEPDATKRAQMYDQYAQMLIDTQCTIICIYETPGLTALTDKVHDSGLGQAFHLTYYKMWLSK